ncbi:MAG: hypothetical protein WC622_13750 [Pedobacter sp.]|jgi:hypothetical protein|uniref:hypothetical protein n=1 Tax=Pedobacter sp. TaxID=1411316 RepID=UPI00356192BA
MRKNLPHLALSRNASKQFLFATIFALLIILIVNFSCKKSEERFKEIATFEKLSKEQNFVNLLKMNNAFLDKIKNLKGALEIINAKKNDEQSMLKLAEYLGFNNINEYKVLLNKQETYKSNLREKFDFEHLSVNENLALKNEISSFIANEFQILKYDTMSNKNKTSVVDPNGGGGPTCSQKRTNCQAGSSAIYTMEGLACIGGAAAIGSGTFGIGGALFYTACASASLVHYNSMLNDCDYTYYDCIGVKTIAE